MVFVVSVDRVEIGQVHPFGADIREFLCLGDRVDMPDQRIIEISATQADASDLS